MNFSFPLLKLFHQQRLIGIFRALVRNCVMTTQICSNRSWVVCETWSWKSSSNPNPNQIFMKSCPVPFAIQDDLVRAYDAGIARGVLTPTQFNDWGIPVVPLRKPLLPGDDKQRLRVCGDYSVTVNPQLAAQCHPLPLPEGLMRKLGGCYGFRKIDLADAYNQVRLGPKCCKRLFR